MGKQNLMRKSVNGLSIGRKSDIIECIILGDTTLTNANKVKILITPKKMVGSLEIIAKESVCEEIKRRANKAIELLRSLQPEIFVTDTMREGIFAQVRA